MKLYLKSKATFGSDGYFRKARTYLANCINFWLNLLHEVLLCKVSWHYATSYLYKPFCFVLKSLYIWHHLIVMCSVSNILQINSPRAYSTIIGWRLCAMHTDSQHVFKVVEHMAVQFTVFTIYKDAENTIFALEWSNIHLLINQLIMLILLVKEPRLVQSILE